MKLKMYLVAGVAFFAVLAFDLVVWGGVRAIPEVGEKIRERAQNQAPMVITYMVVGEYLDRLVPPLGRFGTDYATEAFAEAIPRIKEDPNMAIVALFDQPANSKQSLLRTMFWAMPVLLVVFAFLWWRRPRRVAMMGSRR